MIPCIRLGRVPASAFFTAFFPFCMDEASTHILVRRYWRSTAANTGRYPEGIPFSQDTTKLSLIQNLARLTGGQEAVGSSPVTPTSPSVPMSARIFSLANVVRSIRTQKTAGKVVCERSSFSTLSLLQLLGGY